MLAIVPMDTKQIESDLFAEFWMLYPRKESRKDAMKAWAQIAERHRVTILEAVVDWRRVWHAQGRETHRIPYAATWLRAEKWDDEIPPEFGRPQSAVGTARLPDLPRKSGEIPEKVKAMLAKLKNG